MACQKWKQLFDSQETRKREQQKTFRDEKEALEKELDSQRGNVEAEMYRLGELGHPHLHTAPNSCTHLSHLLTTYISCVFAYVCTYVASALYVSCELISMKRPRCVCVCALVVLNWRDNKVDSFTGSGPPPCPLVMPRMSDKLQTFISQCHCLHMYAHTYSFL